MLGNADLNLVLSGIAGLHIAWRTRASNFTAQKKYFMKWNFSLVARLTTLCFLAIGITVHSQSMSMHHRFTTEPKKVFLAMMDTMMDNMRGNDSFTGDGILYVGYDAILGAE